ncbi:DUF2163 domain-containing protein [Epibacterium sp. SM1979]|uniref:DUF2163 domain-containing protein n=1 Tax=Tritonibacter litoralis TaxID=2662264 RepID=A0A843YDK5_9RHOB|nr:DUF2163 domain-containing protein [Tritonibacter litoralis]MQQ06957.1 DUF2163 domain-containing protein [Tritonibacter litoralis]
MSFANDLRDHLATGSTTVCRAWAITRTDGVQFGFTDHDCDLTFDGLTFRADTGLTARQLEQATGLSVDNTEALGALSSAAVRDEDIEAGRFDGAEVTSWLVNWAAPEMRWLQFRGAIGEIAREDGQFRAELRGLTDLLNQPLGRIYQAPCTAVLGDTACGFDLATPGYAAEAEVIAITDGQTVEIAPQPGFEPEWFTRGVLRILSGSAEGLWGAIKRDLSYANKREITLWEPLRAVVNPGDQIRLEAGCDKRFETCRLKFNNLLNYQGFPDIPGEDWMVAVPRRDHANTGGSRR